MRQSPTNSSNSGNYFPIAHLTNEPLPYGQGSEAPNSALAESAANALASLADEGTAQTPSLRNRVQRSLFERGSPFLPLQNPASLFDHLPGMTENWMHEREENVAKKRKNLNPAVTAKDLGQNPIIPTLPSPLLNLLSSDPFSDKLTLVLSQDQSDLKVHGSSLESFCEVVRLRRQMFRYSTPGKLAAFDDESKPFVMCAFREMIGSTRKENCTLIKSGKPAETYQEQIEIFCDFLSDRVAQKRAKSAQNDDDCIETKNCSVPTDQTGDGIDEILEDLLPHFALDLLKADDRDLTKRFLQAQQLAILITLIR